MPVTVDVATSPFAQSAHLEHHAAPTTNVVANASPTSPHGWLHNQRMLATAACVIVSLFAASGLFAAVTAAGPFAETASVSQSAMPSTEGTPTPPATTDTPSPVTTGDTTGDTTVTTIATDEPTATTATSTTIEQSADATPAPAAVTVPETTTATSAVPGTDVAQPVRLTPTTAITGVYVVGDSLTVGVTGKVEPLLASLNIPVTVDAAGGRRTAAGIAAVAALELTADNVIVVALGTNDNADQASFTTLIDEMITASRGAHVIWLTMDRSGYDTLNTALYAAERRYETMTVADWAAYSNAHPEWDAGDQIHYTGNGYTARAQFIADMVLTIAG